MAKQKPGKKTKALPPTHRIHVYFAGRVQGVGFRHATEEIALEMGIVGWVRNLHDERVEVIAEGSKEILEEFLKRIHDGFLGRHIKKCQSNWEKPTGEFSDFCVEFCF